MSKSSADQNLLFGVLALELDFIDRDQLIHAMRGWVVDKSKSLGQLLVERGELTANRLELLQALVAEHLKQHDGDTSASLASLESTAGVVADLKDVPDDGLQATIDFVSTPDKSGFIETKPSSKVGAALRSVDRFQIGKLHAAGGLGEVFEAQDKELHRTVALKRIKGRFAHHEKSRERFKLEAEITGRLEHPGVVPVYSMGQQDDGQPFYAMRFIEGATLADAIKEHHKKKKTDDRKTDGQKLLDLRRLLQRFIDVCQTIEYAHDRGVLHRDIKPSNVMLGRFGETLVVDWGLAKAAGRDVGHVRSDESTIHPAHGGGTTPTLSGSAIGTPPFMSPEQAAGKIDELTAASDVYSLGATLYTLLTGTTCVRGSNRKTAIERVKTGDFPRPRQVKPSIPPALEAICVMAMALEPEDRYASARDLADDVEHYLADEPVNAYRESWLERSGRWARRHRSWVQAGMAAMLLVTLVSTAAVILINRAWYSERRARQAAVEHFRDARAAVDTWLTGASHVLKYYPAAQRARERLLDLAARDYERFAAEQSDYAELQLEAGRAQLRLGDVRRTVGDPARAEKAYRDAVGVFQELCGQTDDETACVVALANAHTKLGLVLAEAGRTDEAQTNYATAVSELQTQLQSVADEPRCREALATCLFNQSVLSFELGRNDEAAAGIQRAAEEFEDLLDSQPKDRDLLLGGARCRTALGQILSQTGDFRDAADQLAEAVRCLDNLVRQYPDDAELLDARAATQIQIAGLRRTLGQYNRELAAYQQAIDDYRALQRALPDVLSFEENLALTQTDLAQLYLEQGRTGDVESVAREALGVFQTLAEEIPGVPRYVEERAACLDVLGRALSDSGRHGEARQALEQAVGAFGQLGLQFPEVSEYEVRLAAARGHLGTLLHKLGEGDAAREAFEAAVDELQRQAVLAPEAVATRDLLAQVHVQFGNVLADANQPDEAGQSFRQAIDLWDTLVAGDEPADYLDRYAWLLAMCPVEELRNADKSAERAEQACQLAPDNPNYVRTLAAALLRQEQWQAAEEKLVAARTLRGGPHGRDLFLLAMARWGQDDEIGAPAYFNEAAAWMEEHQPDNLELKRLKREAEQMLGIRTDVE